MATAVDKIRRLFGADTASPEPRGPRPGTSPLGVVGTSLFSGYVRDLGEYNSKLQPPAAFQVYEKMRRSDADVAATLLACKLPIRAAEYQIVPGVEDNDPGFAAAKEIAEFVEDNLLGGLEYISPAGLKVSQSFEKVVESALLMLDFGCFAHEEVYAVDSAQVRLARLAPRLPSTFTRFYADTDGETLLSLEQRGYRGDKYETVDIPADRLTLFVFAQEGANFWGRSILRPAYKHWYVKEQLERILALAGEKNGLGVPMIKQAADASKEDREAAALWVERLAAHEKTGLSLPFGWDFALKGVEGRPQDVLPAIRYHSEMIARSVLATFLTLGTTQTGTRSLGESSTGFFKLALESTAWLLAETISQTTIRRLVDFNFGSQESGARSQKIAYPYLRFGNILATDPLEVLKVAKDLVANGVLQVGDEDEGYVREQLGWPKKTAPRPAGGSGGTGVSPVSAHGQDGRATPNQSPEKPILSAEEAGEHWITLENGEHVCIDATGTITKGPAALIGQKPGGGGPKVGGASPKTNGPTNDEPHAGEWQKLPVPAVRYGNEEDLVTINHEGIAEKTKMAVAAEVKIRAGDEEAVVKIWFPKSQASNPAKGKIEIPNWLVHEKIQALESRFMLKPGTHIQISGTYRNGDAYSEPTTQATGPVYDWHRKL